MSDKLSPLEALYWLASRESNRYSIVPILDLASRFCKANGIEGLLETNSDKIIFPEEVVDENSIPGDEESLDYAGGN